MSESKFIWQISNGDLKSWPFFVLNYFSCLFCVYVVLQWHWIGLKTKLYDSWVFNFSYQLPILRNICASNNARPILKEKAGLWNEKVLLQFRPKSGEGAPLVPTALGLTTYILHSLRESTQLQVLSVSAHFLNGKRTVCLCRQIVREWHNGLLISFKSDLIFYLNMPKYLEENLSLNLILDRKLQKHSQICRCLKEANSQKMLWCCLIFKLKPRSSNLRTIVLLYDSLPEIPTFFKYFNQSQLIVNSEQFFDWLKYICKVGIPSHFGFPLNYCT